MLKFLILAVMIIVFFFFVLKRIIHKKKLAANDELYLKLKESEESYRVLAEKYEADVSKLEKQIRDEVSNNKQKDRILIEQSRLAAMGELIASIGHQWRQPLNNLSLLIQDVSEAFVYRELDDEYITKFTKESMVLIKHMSRTINDFRKFYLPNKERTFFSLTESIEDALSIFAISLNYHHILVHYEYRGQQLAFGFHNEFSQAVLNILANARDAFVEKEVSNRSIIIEIEETKSYYITKIMDNAGGIAANLIDKIFDPYYTTKKNGTGLGLYMTKIILKNMNGEIKVRNTQEGAEFQLFVPKGRPAISIKTA